MQAEDEAHEPGASGGARRCGGLRRLVRAARPRHLRLLLPAHGRRSSGRGPGSGGFLEAWRRRPDLNLARNAVRPWLFGVALNLLRNHRRSLRRYRAALGRLPRPRADADLGDELAARLDDERRAREALRHFQRLPRGERDVVALCAWAELSYDEAAKVLRVPVGTVRSRLARARARLAPHATEQPDKRADR